LGVGGSIGVIAGAVALGVRHGIDWDHIAAITDITTTTASFRAREAWLVEEPGVQLTDESHHSSGADPQTAAVVSEARQAIAELRPDPLGAAVGAKSRSPNMAPHSGLMRVGALVAEFATTQRRPLFLGTLYALGHGSMVVFLGLLAILAREILPDWIDPVMERVVGATLIFLAVYLFYSVYRFFRSGDEFRIRSRWMLIFAGFRNLLGRLRAGIRGEEFHHHPGSDQYGVRTAYTVGLIHGIGAETGTQVLIIGTAVGAESKPMAVATLFAFVFGLLVSNSMVTLMSTAGFVSARRRQLVYVAAGLVAAVFSLVIGAIFLVQQGATLPDLGQYFRWIGGPD
jgi:high-affinity nickel-transport protein